MTGRERVLRTLEFNHPDRVPRDLWMLPGARLGHGEAAIAQFQQRWPTDFVQVSAGKPKALRTQGDAYAPGTFRDEWGCEFENLLAGVHGEVRHPLLDDYARLGDVRPPTELLNIDVAAANAFCDAQDRFVLASGWARTFERMQFLRGSENLFMDLAEEPAEFHELLRLVHAFNRDQLEAWSRTRADALVIMDDWGSQRSLLIAPDQWRRLFKPLYAEYSRIAHDSGKKLFMHSDGCIMDIYDDLIEIGVDAINSQLFCMDIEEIGRRCRGRITFWGEIDRQHILPFGTPADARAAVERVAANLRPAADAGGGGVIAQFELSGGTPLANADAVYEAWLAVR